MSEEKAQSKQNEESSTLTLDHPDGGKITYLIRPMSVNAYYTMNTYIKKNRPFEGFVRAIEQLRISGDTPDDLLNDPKYFPCLMALEDILTEMCKPCGGELKKN